MSGSVAETATLVHGFTMADLDKAAKKAAATNSSFSLLQWEDRYDAAWMAIVESLYAAIERPTFRELVLVGLKAVSSENHAHRSTHGLGGAHRRDGDVSPSFKTYWTRRGDSDFTDAIAERLALRTVLGLLDGRQYEVIVALAVHGTQEKAAQALGIHPLTVNRRVKAARRIMIDAWFAPETPPDTSIRSRDAETCRYGHSRAEHSFVRPNDGGIRCRVCERNRSRRRKARSGSDRFAE